MAGSSTTGTDSLLRPEQVQPAAQLVRQTLEQLDNILLGRPHLHQLVMTGILCRGHILLEGLPGVGKTALIAALGHVLQLDFKRVQFTPDLMPGDILGTHILQTADDGSKRMQFEPGPVFTNILLADEINRASPKTQSALLEAMQEQHVTLMGTSRALPDPFFVLASQNPIELEGTYPLPEAQLDRFLFKLNVEAADVGTMEAIIRTRRRGTPPKPTWSMTAEQLGSIFDVMQQIFLPKPVANYIARLTAATHPAADAPERITRYVQYGASPRAAIAMAEASRAQALIAGRPTVGFEDVRVVAPAVLNHRLLLNYQARFDRVTSTDIVGDLLSQLDETAMDLPDDVRVG